jgi:amidophosphoribosyltransferase
MCAIFGIAGAEEASNLTYLGLHALQHRGQEGTGIVSTTGKEPFVHKDRGLVGDIFSAAVISKLQGHSAIGHNRYSTTGGNTTENLQPLLMKSSLGWVSIAHNGNLVNSTEITQKLEKEGSIFQSTSDTEVILHLMARSQERDLVKALIQALRQITGAYSLLVLNQEYLVAIRDPQGFRPLVMGKLNNKPVFASETTAFDLIGATYEREVRPGEMVIVSLKDNFSIQSIQPLEVFPQRRCVFEHVYFARPDSVVFGSNIYQTRKNLGKELAKEQPAQNADIVIPVPDSGVYAAIGYSEFSKLPFEMGIIRSHYIGRTFIEPRQSIRDFGVKLKLNPVAETIKGKSIVVVDDSLVRGTTSRKLIQHLRDAGAKEVHLRISAPPTAHPCFYGIDTPTKKELLASSNSIEKIRSFVGADSLGYLSLDGLLKVSSELAGEGFCHACFSGDYPTPTYNN